MRLWRAFLRGCCPHEFSWLLDNRLRRSFLTPEELADRLSIAPHYRLLEIGPGSGYFSVELARRVPNGRLEVFDIQPEMLAKARRKLDAKSITNVGFHTGDAGAGLPFLAAHFDLAILVTVLGEIPDQLACIRSVHQVLRAEGLLAIHEHLPDPHFQRHETVRSKIEGNGFVFEQRWGPWWNYTATFRKSARNQ